MMNEQDRRRQLGALLESIQERNDTIERLVLKIEQVTTGGEATRGALAQINTATAGIKSTIDEIAALVVK